jgi:putative transposase
MPDAGLVEAIRQVLAKSAFRGEGYPKIWARPRHAGLRTSKKRVRRPMREHGVTASRRGTPQGPNRHDGTIVPAAVDTAAPRESRLWRKSLQPKAAVLAEAHPPEGRLR